MKQELHTFDAPFKTRMKEVGYKHVAMDTAEGERIVSFNQPSQKIENKFEEIRKRLTVLPDGIYRLHFTYSYGSKAKPDTFLIKKGVVREEQLSEERSTQVVKIVKEKATKEDKSMEQVLSLPEALKRIEELSVLRSENTVLKDKIAKLEEEIEELEEEIEEQKSTAKPLSEHEGMNGVGGWLKEIAPQLLPIADEYFKTRNRELSIREKQLSQRRPTIVRQPTRRAPQPPSVEQIVAEFDVNNTQALENLFDELDTMDDQQFNQVLEIASKHNPELASLIESEFFEEEEEEEQQQSNPNE